jgi:hypothetical protein
VARLLKELRLVKCYICFLFTLFKCLIASVKYNSEAAFTLNSNILSSEIDCLPEKCNRSSNLNHIDILLFKLLYARNYFKSSQFTIWCSLRRVCLYIFFTQQSSLRCRELQSGPGPGPAGTGTGTGTKIWLFTGPGLKIFYTGPAQFFLQYIFTFTCWILKINIEI